MPLDRFWNDVAGVLRVHLGSPDGPPVALVDPDGSIAECNRAFDQLVGGVEGAAGRRLSDLSPRERVTPSPAGESRRLTLRLGTGSQQTVTFHVYPCTAGLALIGERVLFTETRVIEGLSTLHDELINTTRELHKKNIALEEAKARIRTLRGLLPICCSCKKIRDDRGYWEQIEVYVRDRTDAEFTHSICPACVKKLYPELDEER